MEILEDFGYEANEVYPFDMFPKTAHVETVVLLSREKADDYIRISVHTEDLKAKAN
jgi:23S rRNA (uracil1939-C5)-methyltransferase